MEKIKRKFFGKDKGFTLVELIVVLVILAIIAALLVPSLTGYIDRARNQSIITETRMAVMAAQTVTSQNYGKSTSFEEVTAVTLLTSYMGDTKAGSLIDGFDPACIDSYTADVNGKVTALKYIKGNKTCTYSSSDAAEPYKIS